MTLRERAEAFVQMTVAPDYDGYSRCGTGTGYMTGNVDVWFSLPVYSSERRTIIDLALKACRLEFADGLFIEPAQLAGSSQLCLMVQAWVKEA